MELKDFFREYPAVALAFSGGTDSVYLLSQAIKYAQNVRAYFVKSAFQPAFELEDARRAARETGAELTVIEADILSAPEVCENPANRCYFCKKIIFGLIAERAQADGYCVIIDGTNASDDEGDRPGMKALREMKVLSPLKICGLTKDRIRQLSKEEGLFTWDKPAYACLATRVPAGEIITQEKLRKTEESENIMFSLGFEDFRVRMSGNSAKIQIKKEQLPLFAEKENEIKRLLMKNYDEIILDREVFR